MFSVACIINMLTISVMSSLVKLIAFLPSQPLLAS